jgi:hypothetical protein
MLVNPNSEINPILDDYTPLDNLLTLDSDLDEFEWEGLTSPPEFEIVSLSTEMGVNLDWNLDEMSSEEILGFDNDLDNQSDHF